MFDADQLGWILRNRSGRRRTEQIGASAAHLLEKVQRRVSSEPAEAVGQAIAAVVDEDFVHHCKVGEVRSGKLVISVDDERLVYAYRARWSRSLSERIREACPGCGVWGVQFIKAERRGALAPPS